MRIGFFRAAIPALIMSLGALGQSSVPNSDVSKTIPVVDGGAGPCSADFTITDSAGAPVYAAKIKVHIAYRALSLHKLDLEVGTNADGRGRFTGLPDRVKRGMYFEASEGDRAGQAFVDPAVNCKAQFTIELHKKKE